MESNKNSKDNDISKKMFLILSIVIIISGIYFIFFKNQNIGISIVLVGIAFPIMQLSREKNKVKSFKGALVSLIILIIAFIFMISGVISSLTN